MAHVGSFWHSKCIVSVKRSDESFGCSSSDIYCVIPHVRFLAQLYKNNLLTGLYLGFCWEQLIRHLTIWWNKVSHNITHVKGQIISMIKLFDWAKIKKAALGFSFVWDVKIVVSVRNFLVLSFFSSTLFYYSTIGSVGQVFILISLACLLVVGWLGCTKHRPGISRDLVDKSNLSR